MKAQGCFFIMGHMRSFSTVLSHQLGSHPYVTGHIERHQSYTSLSSFATWRSGCRKGWFFDKILHNYISVNPELIESLQIPLIYIVRRPEDTIDSLIRLGEKWGDGLSWSTPDGATIYYIERLRHLIKHAFETPRLLIHAEEIVLSNASVCEKISCFLGLDPALEPDTYQVFPDTGKRDAMQGDSSDRIRSGKIQNEQREPDVSKVSADLIIEAKAIYEKWLLLSDKHLQ